MTLLRAITALIGVAVLIALLVEPHFEGRNAHVTGLKVYFGDPFLAYAYVASVPFFVALYQAFKALGYAAKNEASSGAVMKALRTIRYCAIVTIGSVALGEIFIALGDSDDRAGGVCVGGLIAFGSGVGAVTVAMFERALVRGDEDAILPP
ncbi:MAG TPA: DUF2975 domain-containing protein [Polyangiaceae bacterium]|nr:DUF2975 domain-containing protein [Polyangiaceae bacterium]